MKQQTSSIGIRLAQCAALRRVAPAGLGLLVAALGCGGALAADIAGSARMTDAAIDVDERNYEAQQAAIAALNATGRHPVRSYSVAKAQCWLDVSFHEYTRNDRSSFPDEALAQSRAITDFLAAGAAADDAANPAGQTPLVNGAARLREDLWQRVAAMKRDAAFDCAAALVACAEVELVHAGNEFNQQQWNHARPYVQLAEDRLAEAGSAMSACAAPATTAPATALAATAAGVPAAPAAGAELPVTENLTLIASALFEFDRRRQSDLLPEGRAQLDELARRITQVFARVNGIRLIGHTDRLGGEDYNERLSLDRANAVRDYLQARGVEAPIVTEGRGEREPIAQCEGARRSVATAACLQPNRRVEVELTGVRR